MSKCENCPLWVRPFMCQAENINRAGDCHFSPADLAALKAALADKSLVLVARPIGMAGFMEQVQGAARGEE